MDYLDTKLVPAHWLKIAPVQLGDTKGFIFITVLVNVAAEAKFLGLSSIYAPRINLKPNFNFPGFMKETDNINTNLTIQLFSEGMPLSLFNTRINNFIKNNAAEEKK